MAIPLLVRQRLAACKLETTAGTAESLTNAEGAHKLWNHKLDYEIPFNAVEGQSSLDPHPGIPGARSGKFSFTTHLMNLSADASALLAIVFQTAGMSVTSGTYTVQTGGAAAKTATWGLYQDGRLKQIKGACCDFTLKGKTGNPVEVDVTATGCYVAPSSTALLTPTYPSTIAPRLASATISIGGTTTYKIGEVEIGIGNTVTLIEDITDSSGYVNAVVTLRESYVKVNPMSLLLSTKDWYSHYLAGTEAALSLVIGSGTGGTCTITAPKMQLRKPPEDGDTGGYLTDQLEFQLNRSAAAGDDALVIAFT